MSSIRAAVMPGPHQAIELREFAKPALEDGAALLRVLYSEVCGTDVHLHEGRLSGVPYPIIPGHVTTGVLEKIRGRMRDVNGRDFQEGDTVTFLDVHRTCHACWYCLVAKASTRCPQRKVYGITYGVEDGLTGGWAEKMYLKPGTHCLSLAGVDPKLFMAGGCGLPTSVHAVEQANIQLGESVLVLGAGPVGLSCVALAALRGAGQVLCIGAPQHRLATASEIGATAIFDITGTMAEQREAWVREQTAGRGADVTIEACGDPAAVVQAMRWTRDAGRVVIVGQYTDAGETSFNPHLDLNRKHLRIQGVWGCDYSHVYRAVQLLHHAYAGEIYARIPTASYSLAQANAALADVAAGRVTKALIAPSR